MALLFWLLLTWALGMDYWRSAGISRMDGVRNERTREIIEVETTIIKEIQRNQNFFKDFIVSFTSFIVSLFKLKSNILISLLFMFDISMKSWRFSGSNS